MLNIRIDRPADRVDRDIRVYLDGHDVSHGVTGVDLVHRIGEPPEIVLRLLGDLDLRTLESTTERAA